jgi:hypothetical protein
MLLNYFSRPAEEAGMMDAEAANGYFKVSSSHAPFFST